MAFARGKPRPANSGRRKGSRNKSTLAGAPKTYPGALEHLAKVMTSADGTITPDLKLRAAVALAQYQHSKPTPARGGTLIDPIPYMAPKTVEEARSLILELGERLAKVGYRSSCILFRPTPSRAILASCASASTRTRPTP